MCPGPCSRAASAGGQSHGIHERVIRPRSPLVAVRAALRVTPPVGPGDGAVRVMLFNEEEQVALTLLIVAINGWNRIQVGFRAVHPVEERKTA